MARRKEPWSYTAGERPHQVTVYERVAGGPISVRIWDPTLRRGKGEMVRRSLKHKDREKAREYAGRPAAALAKWESDLANGRTRLGEVFASYMRHRTPRKSLRSQKEDARRVELWARTLSADRDSHHLTLREWEAFIDRRTSGEIDARGMVVERPKAVRPRIVEADCVWLNAVYGWAVKWKTERG